LYPTKPVFEKTCATTKKTWKSHVFLDFEKPQKRTYKAYSFTGHLLTQHLITQLPERPEVSTGRSPSNITSCSEVRTQETILHATSQHGSHSGVRKMGIELQ